MKLSGQRQLDERRVAQFAAVVETGSIRAGAEALEMDPSVVSRSVARLEEEWGMILLERKGRGITVTEAGKLLYSYYQRHQVLKQDLIAQTEAMVTLDGGHVDVLYGKGYSAVMSIAVNRFTAKYPNVYFNLMDDSSASAYKRVLSDEFMIGMFMMKGVDPALRSHYSLSEPVCAIVRAGHPLTQLERPLRLRDLLEYNGYVVSPAYSINQLISAAEIHDDLSLKVSITSSSINILLAALLQTEGFTLLPARGLRTWMEKRALIAIEVDNPVLRHVQNSILTRHSRILPPAAREFIKELILVYREYEGDLAANGNLPVLFEGEG